MHRLAHDAAAHAQLRGKLALTDAAFYRDRLLPFLGNDPTKWTKLQRNLEAGGSYTGRTADLEPKLAEALAALKETLRYDEVKARVAERPFRETSIARQLSSRLPSTGQCMRYRSTWSRPRSCRLAANACFVLS